MKFMDLVLEVSERRVGREYQHLEDFVYTQGGSPGARQALEILRRLNQGTNSVTVKFDGHPNIYWGRRNGQFTLTPKSGWGKQWFTSAEEVSDWFANKNHGEDWRKRYARVLYDAWRILEKNTPEDFEGFVYGDLLYYPSKPQKTSDATVTFGPGKVTYSVPINTTVGRLIADSKLGVAAHMTYAKYGDTSGKIITGTQELNTPEVVVFGQIPVVIKPGLSEQGLDRIEEMIDEYATDMNGFLTVRPGFSDVAAIIYRYVNHMSKTQQLENLHDGFLPWVEQSNVSANKKKKLNDLIKIYPNALPGIFGIFTAIMHMKNMLIKKLDLANKTISSSVNGQPGGEGYIDQKSRAKLIPRHRWQPVWDD